MNFEFIKKAKISIKLTALYAVMFSLVLLILNASILYGIRYYFNSHAVREVDATKTIILNKVNGKTGSVNLESNDIIVSVPVKENIALRAIKEDGTVINQSGNFNYQVKTEEPYNRIIRQEANDKHLIYENLKYENSQYGTVIIQIVKDLESEYRFLKILFVFMAAADFIGMIASIVVGFIVSKGMLKPVDEMTRTAQKISIHNLKERIAVRESKDELERLAETLNSMIDRLQNSFDRQIQFVSDASHELRTPIAVIQGHANLIRRWGKDDKEALEKSIAAINAEAAGMAQLVEKLLFLAKGDSNTLKADKSEFNLQELIMEVVQESKLIDKEHLITNKKNAEAVIFADYKMVKQLLRILIDNSIKYTPAKGSIDISSIRAGKTVKITVTDTGAGIPEEEIDYIFQRFYTVDKSRSKVLVGSGLGLSIAKQIVDMNNGTITVESAEGKGTIIDVTFGDSGE